MGWGGICTCVSVCVFAGGGVRVHVLWWYSGVCVYVCLFMLAPAVSNLLYSVFLCRLVKSIQQMKFCSKAPDHTTLIQFSKTREFYHLASILSQK